MVFLPLSIRYELHFLVYDRKHTQTNVPANVTVIVREIPEEAVLKSGSLRIHGISDEDFIRIWDYKVSFRPTSIFKTFWYWEYLCLPVMYHRELSGFQLQPNFSLSYVDPTGCAKQTGALQEGSG